MDEERQEYASEGARLVATLDPGELDQRISEIEDQGVLREIDEALGQFGYARENRRRLRLAMRLAQLTGEIPGVLRDEAAAVDLIADYDARFGEPNTVSEEE